MKSNTAVIYFKSRRFRHYMTKKLQFINYWDKYVRKFTVIYIYGGELFIEHTISKKRTEIEFKDIKEWVNYFDRI